MTWFSICLDIAVVLLIIGGIYKGRRDGFLKSLILFVGSLASLIIAGYLSHWFSDWLYDSFLREKIAASVLEAMQNTGAESLKTSLQGVLPAIGGLLGMIAKAFNFTSLQISADQLKQALTGNLEGLSGTLTDQIFGPPVKGLVAVIAFVVLFGLCMIVFRLIGRTLQAVNNVPVVGGINRLLGMVFGLANAAFWLLALSFLFYLVMRMLPASELFSRQTLESTWLFGWVYFHNPLVSLFS